MFSSVLGKIPPRGYPAGFSTHLVRHVAPRERGQSADLAQVARLAERVHADARPAEGTEVDQEASAA